MGRVASFVMGVFAATVLAAALVIPRLLDAGAERHTAGLSLSATGPTATSVRAAPLPVLRPRHRPAADRRQRAASSTSHFGLVPTFAGTTPPFDTPAPAPTPSPVAQFASVTSKPVTHRHVKQSQTPRPVADGGHPAASANQPGSDPSA